MVVGTPIWGCGCRWLGLTKEGIRIRWYGRASNPVGGVSRSRVGSTPAAFRPMLDSSETYVTTRNHRTRFPVDVPRLGRRMYGLSRLARRGSLGKRHRIADSGSRPASRSTRAPSCDHCGVAIVPWVLRPSSPMTCHRLRARRPFFPKHGVLHRVLVDRCAEAIVPERHKLLEDSFLPHAEFFTKPA